jgi:hypothetical protein
VIFEETQHRIALRLQARGAETLSIVGRFEEEFLIR